MFAHPESVRTASSPPATASSLRMVPSSGVSGHGRSKTGTTRAVTERVLGVKEHGACHRNATIVRSLTLERSPNLIPRHGRLAHADSGANGDARAPPCLLRVWRQPGRRRGHQEGAEGDPRPPRRAREVGAAGEADAAADHPASPADRPGEGLQHPALELAGAGSRRRQGDGRRVRRLPVSLLGSGGGADDGSARVVSEGRPRGLQAVSSLLDSSSGDGGVEGGARRRPAGKVLGDARSALPESAGPEPREAHSAGRVLAPRRHAVPEGPGIAGGARRDLARAAGGEGRRRAGHAHDLRERQAADKPLARRLPADDRQLPRSPDGVTRGTAVAGRLVALALPVVLGCTSVPYTNRSQLILVSQRDEVTMGAQAFREVVSQSRLDRTPGLDRSVQDVGQRLVAVANRPDFQWKFVVFDDDKQVNAFCLPGGKVAVYTGILPVARDQAGLAVMLGPDIAHAGARAGAAGRSKSKLAQSGSAALAVGLGSSASSSAILAAYGLGARYGILLPYSRTQESEADHIGLLLMAQAGYDPRVAV